MSSRVLSLLSTHRLVEPAADFGSQGRGVADLAVAEGGVAEEETLPRGEPSGAGPIRARPTTGSIRQRRGVDRRGEVLSPGRPTGLRLFD